MLILFIFTITLILLLSCLYKKSLLDAFFIYFGTFTIFNTIFRTLEVSANVHLILFILFIFYLFKNIKSIDISKCKIQFGFIGISLVLVYFINHYFNGTNLNESGYLAEYLNSVLQQTYQPIVHPKYFLMDFFIPFLDSSNTFVLIDQFTSIVSFTYFYLLLNLLCNVYSNHRNQHTLTGIILYSTYFISIAGFTTNYLNYMWLLFPITLLLTYIDTDTIDIHYIAFYLIIGLLIDYRLFLTPFLIVTTIKWYKRNNYIYIGCTLLFFILSLIFNMYSESFISILLSSSNLDLLPFIYINKKPILVTVLIVLLIITNPLYLKKEFITKYGLSILLVLISFVTKNPSLILSTLFIIFNPHTFNKIMNTFQSSILFKVFNLKNVAFASLLVFILVVSDSLTDNPSKIQFPSNIKYLSTQEHKLYEYIQENYGYDVSIKSALDSTQAYFLNTNNEENPILEIKHYPDITKSDNVEFNTFYYALIKK